MILEPPEGVLHAVFFFRYGERLLKLEDLTLAALSDLIDDWRSKKGRPIDPQNALHDVTVSIISSLVNMTTKNYPHGWTQDLLFGGDQTSWGPDGNQRKFSHVESKKFERKNMNGSPTESSFHKLQAFGQPLNEEESAQNLAMQLSIVTRVQPGGPGQVSARNQTCRFGGDSNRNPNWSVKWGGQHFAVG